MTEPLNGANGVYRFPISDGVLYTVTKHRHFTLGSERFAVHLYTGERELVQKYCGCFGTYALACQHVEDLNRRARALKRNAGRARGDNG